MQVTIFEDIDSFTINNSEVTFEDRFIKFLIFPFPSNEVIKHFLVRMFPDNMDHFSVFFFRNSDIGCAIDKDILGQHQFEDNFVLDFILGQILFQISVIDFDVHFGLHFHGLVPQLLKQFQNESVNSVLQIEMPGHFGNYRHHVAKILKVVTLNHILIQSVKKLLPSFGCFLVRAKEHFKPSHIFDHVVNILFIFGVLKKNFDFPGYLREKNFFAFFSHFNELFFHQAHLLRVTEYRLKLIKIFWQFGVENLIYQFALSTGAIENCLERVFSFLKLVLYLHFYNKSEPKFVFNINLS